MAILTGSLKSGVSSKNAIDLEIYFYKKETNEYNTINIVAFAFVLAK